jgi:leader peptidase (prepilin peptidase)/N-methyltransferase
MQAQPAIWALPLCGLILGAIIGSFLATLVLRWPEGRSIATGRSACDNCGRMLTASELVPILSFVVFRGRARCCGTRIARLHPTTEILAAIIGATAFLVAPPLDAMAGALFGWLLLTLALLDWRHFWLPARLTYSLGIAGLIVGWAGIGAPLHDRIIGGLVGFAAFEAIRLGYRRLRHRDGMGAGDVRLFAGIGLWLGWRPLPLVLLLASLAGLIWCVILIVTRRRAPIGKVQFGAFLALAGWAIWIALQSSWLSPSFGGAIGP